MRTTLKADIDISHVAVFAEMALLERRPELGLLCRNASLNANRLTAAVVQSALPGLSDAGAGNVIAWCKSLGLCDANGGITSLGEEVAKTNEAPVPEQGAYEMWIAKHPLVGSKVLAVRRLAGRQPDTNYDAIEPLQIRPDMGKVFRSVIDKNVRFIVRSLPANHGQPGSMIDGHETTCRISWTLDFDECTDHWQIDGVLDIPGNHGSPESRPILHDAESDGVDLWALASRWSSGPLREHGRWMAQKKSLSVKFDGLSEAEIGSFRKTLDLGKVDIPGKGSYTDVVLEDVSICPESKEDAQSWALALLWKYLSDRPGYRSRAELRQQFAALTEGTPLEEHSPRLPSHADLLDEATESRELFWSLAATVDLCPFVLTDDELGILEIGAQSQNTEISSPSYFRVPYRGGWSMRKFVDRALNGASPARVLLCDGYVRGDHLATFRLLVDTLRATNPKVRIDTWTKDEEPDFKVIQEIAGEQPGRYREIFGRSIPHDRYLLVVTTTGEEICWQMSNSPIHARADLKDASPETPLRWKDLAATNIPSDELMPAFLQWLKGKTL